MNVKNRTKIANFPTPVYLTPPMKGFPVEFGIGVRGPKCLNDGPTRWSKKFSDRFSRFDTIPAVTDSQPASHPASQPRRRITITLNAKASSLKTMLSENSTGDLATAIITSVKDVMYSSSIVCLLAGLRKTTRPISANFVYRWHVGKQANVSDFDGDPDHVTLRLGLQ